MKLKKVNIYPLHRFRGRCKDYKFCIRCGVTKERIGSYIMYSRRGSFSVNNKRPKCKPFRIPVLVFWIAYILILYIIKIII